MAKKSLFEVPRLPPHTSSQYCLQVGRFAGRSTEANWCSTELHYGTTPFACPELGTAPFAVLKLVLRCTQVDSLLHGHPYTRVHLKLRRGEGVMECARAHGQPLQLSAHGLWFRVHASGCGSRRAVGAYGRATECPVLT
eukprot:935030-Rhodomonas_salina.2